MAQVVEVGAKVDKKLFDVGAEVFGRSSAGSLAEFVVCSPDDLALKPENASFVEAASLPTVALTGLQAMQTAGLKAGETVLVIGASGG